MPLDGAADISEGLFNRQRKVAGTNEANLNDAGQVVNNEVSVRVCNELHFTGNET